jgi:hypothetical protein
MHTPTFFRKIYQGAATRQEMFSLFDRHAQAPMDEDRVSGRLHVGEWFEIGAAEHDYMLNILPPLFMRDGMFAMSEFLADRITSIFVALVIDGRGRWFHGYCDLSDKGSPDRLRSAILERETRPVKAMSREERLEHIWSSTHPDYRGYADQCWPVAVRGKRTMLVYGGCGVTELKLLEYLDENEIAAKLPVQLRHLPEPIAA